MTRRFRLGLIAVWVTLLFVPPGPLQAQSFFDQIFEKAKKGFEKITPGPKKEIKATDRKNFKARRWRRLLGGEFRGLWPTLRGWVHLYHCRVLT